MRESRIAAILRQFFGAWAIVNSPAAFVSPRPRRRKGVRQLSFACRKLWIKSRRRARSPARAHRALVGVHALCSAVHISATRTLQGVDFLALCNRLDELAGSTRRRKSRLGTFLDHTLR